MRRADRCHCSISCRSPAAPSPRRASASTRWLPTWPTPTPSPAPTARPTRPGRSCSRRPRPAKSATAHAGQPHVGTAGVRVANVVEDQSPGKKTFDPKHPSADAEGYVTHSNVNVVEEMVNMISASRSYQNNIEIMNTAQQLAMKTLQLGQYARRRSTTQEQAAPHADEHHDRRLTWPSTKQSSSTDPACRRRRRPRRSSRAPRLRAMRTACQSRQRPGRRGGHRRRHRGPVPQAAGRADAQPGSAQSDGQRPGHQPAGADQHGARHRRPEQDDDRLRHRQRAELGDVVGGDAGQAGAGAQAILQLPAGCRRRRRPGSASSSRAPATAARLEIVDAAGTVVHTRTMANVAAGMQTFEWDGKNANGSAVPAGPLSVTDRCRRRHGRRRGGRPGAGAGRRHQPGGRRDPSSSSTARRRWRPPDVRVIL